MLIREANELDAPGIARVQVDAWRTTYKAIVPDSYLTSLNYENREQRWQQILASDENHFAFVAETEDKQIVGFASAGKNREPSEDFAGELYAIYVLENYSASRSRQTFNKSRRTAFLKARNIFYIGVGFSGESVQGILRIAWWQVCFRERNRHWKLAAN